MQTAEQKQSFIGSVAKQIVPLIRQNMILGNLVYRDYEPFPTKQNDSLNVPLLPTPPDKHMGNARFFFDNHFESSIYWDVQQMASDRIQEHPAFGAMANAIGTGIEKSLIANFREFDAYEPIQVVGQLNETHIKSAQALLGAAEQHLVVDHQGLVDMRQADYYETQIHHSQLLTPGHYLAFDNKALMLATRPPVTEPAINRFASLHDEDGFGVRAYVDWQEGSSSQIINVDLIYACGPLLKDHAVQIKRF